MIYTPLTIRAMQIAYRAHHGQHDKGGVPYIFHPIHLAEQMQDEYSTCVALLHDVVEDTDVTMEELRAVFPAEVTDAVALMTHREDEPYLEYVRRAATNPITKAVKLADIRHNSDSSRLPDAGEDKLRYFADKYQAALAVLNQGD